MDVRIRLASEAEGVCVCQVAHPQDVVTVVRALGRAGGIHIKNSANPTKEFAYRFVQTDKQFYAEIVVHDEPQA